MRQIILLVILILVAAFAYLYFFTGLIKPHEEAPAPPPAVAVKQPIPPRTDQPGAAQPAPATPAPAAAPATPEAAPVKPATAPVKPEAVPVPAQKPVPAKAQPSPAKPAAAAKAPVVPTKDQKPAPAKSAPVKPAPVAAKAAAPAKPAAKVTGAEQKLPAKKETAKPAVAAASAAKKTAGHYTLAIGTYVLEKSMSSDKAKLKKAGLVPAVKKGDMKQEPMTRLYLATYPNYDEAAAALKQLRQSSGDGFFLTEGDRYAVYAGSYFQESRAAVEHDRLSGKGIKTVMRKVKVPVPTYRMTAGSFSTREDAVQAVARLKKSGIRAAVIRLK